MNTLRQEFCDETNTPMGLDNEFDYIRWLEAQIQALRIHEVVGQSEQCCEPLSEGFYLGTSCPKCKQPFRQNLK